MPTLSHPSPLYEPELNRVGSFCIEILLSGAGQTTAFLCPRPRLCNGDNLIPSHKNEPISPMCPKKVTDIENVNRIKDDKATESHS